MEMEIMLLLLSHCVLLLETRKSLLPRLPQALLHLGLAKIWMVLRDLGDGNVDLNATTGVMKVMLRNVTIYVLSCMCLWKKWKWFI